MPSLTPTPRRDDEPLSSSGAKTFDALTFGSPELITTRAVDRHALAHDASHYRMVPSAVARPRNVTDLGLLLAGASRSGVPLTFRSGGTSLSGQASSNRVLVDTRRHFRDVTVLDEGARVRTQPGVTVRAVNARLARFGRKLGPDPASEIACTIGGVIANNSSGMACGIEQNTYRTLSSSILVLPSGTVLDTSQEDADDILGQSDPRIHQGLGELRQRIHENAASLQTIARLYAMKNTMGYGLNSFVDFSRPIDMLEHLVIGSEGTLAFVAEATFSTIAMKPHVATALLLFEDLAIATGVLPQLVAAGFAAIELLDATSLRVAQRDPSASPELRTLQVRNHAALLVEFQELDVEALACRLENCRDLLAELPLCAPSRLTVDAGLRASYWHIRKGLYASVAGSRPAGTTALLEDIAVPIERLLPACTELSDLLLEHRYEGSVIFGHAKDGNIHFMLNEKFDDPTSLHRYHAFTDEMVDLVLGHGGTLKAEHGTGRVMAPYVRNQYGTELYEVMREIKHLVDPLGILNPGVLIEAESEEPQYKTGLTIEAEVDQCVECGYCEPICPSKDLTLTPRQRIVLRREMRSAESLGDTRLFLDLRAAYEYHGVDTCAVDSLCQTSCPLHIDTGQLARGLRTARVGTVQQAVWQTAAEHWTIGTTLASLALTSAKYLAPLAATATRAARRIGKQDIIPEWSRDLPAGGSTRTPVPADNPSVVYFPSCTSSMFAPAEGGVGVGDAFMALCARAGVEVRTPDGIGSLCCGTPWKSKGLEAGLSSMQERVSKAMWEASDHGALPIVSDAASCTEGLQDMLGQALLQGGAFTVIDALAFADDVLLVRLPMPRKVKSLVLHPTCSTTHLGLNDVLARVANFVAEQVTIPDDWGCCAFAGDRGMLHPELTRSATQREAAEIATSSFDAYASANRTCELGLSRATGHPYQHLLELLEIATRSSSPTRP